MSSKARDLLKLSAIIAVTFSLGITLASAFNIPRPGVAEARRFAASPPVGGPVGLSGRRSDTPMSFADVVDRVNPSVVYVQVRVPARQQQLNRNDIPPEFQDFFRRFQGQGPQERFRHGSGTGVIVSQDGYILTNNHVVADADSIRVKLLDNREFSGRVIGRDPNTDVAVIRIQASGLPAVTLGNSDQARIGDWVLAFGNPLSFNFTVTAGIVSAKGRVLPDLRDENARFSIQDFIQTDAAINPGNSGGPLVNMNGEVIGINAAIASQTGLYSGYGFAIPINLVRHVMDDLIAKGHVDRAILGIGISDVTPDAAALVGLDQVKGVYVSTYSDDASPARRAGILLGDVIIAVNDTAVERQAQLQQMIGFRHPGEVVRVTVARHEDGRNARHTINVRLAAAPGSTDVAQAAGDTATTASREMEGRLGLRVAPLTSMDIRQARLTDDQRGVVVADVEEDGPAWGKIALPAQGPDIILKVNDVRVHTPEEFKAALRAVPARGIVQLTVLHMGDDPQRGVTRAVVVRSR